MHPDFIGQIARERNYEARRFAARDARAAGAARPSRPSIRNRAGWTLVHIGLRLAAR